MDIFSILSMLGGLALFLYGMNSMGDGLAKVSGGKLERILETLTASPLKAVLLGLGVTAVIQSSSATTVMVIGFVNSSIMRLSQAIGVIMGANIGTTVTSWLLSLTGIEGDNFWIQLCKPSSFSPILAVIGIVFLLFVKSSKKKDIGTILLGFAVLMFGMEAMSEAVAPLAGNETFTSMLTAFQNPILGMLAGALLTAIIQSSSASVGILQVLCSTGAVSFGAAIPIILGQNIGTCATALLSSIGASKNARRAAVVHLYFNLIGTAAFMALFYGAQIFTEFAFLNDAATPVGIAAFHSIFNVFATILLVPFPKFLEKLACMTVRDKAEKKETAADPLAMLDPRFLEKPGFAIEQSFHVATDMATEAKKALSTAMELFDRFDEKKAQSVRELEALVDRYEDGLGSYLVKLGRRDLNRHDSHTLSIILHCIGEFERVSDHAVNLLEAAEEMHQKKLSFSPQAKEEMNVLMKAVRDIVEASYQVFTTQNAQQAVFVEPLEEVIDELKQELKNRHIRRLREGKCTIELGFILSDITTGLERIADHCSNISVCVTQVRDDQYDTHSYLERVKTEDPTAFQSLVRKAEKEYLLP